MMRADDLRLMPTPALSRWPNGSLLNFEAATSHNITIRATSSDLSTATQVMTITLTDVNETPVLSRIQRPQSKPAERATAVPGTDPSGNVLTNDTDIDAGDTKAVSGVVAGTSASASGSVGANVAGRMARSISRRTARSATSSITTTRRCRRFEPAAIR
jgi:hypothetical protein